MYVYRVDKKGQRCGPYSDTDLGQRPRKLLRCYPCFDAYDGNNETYEVLT